MAESLIDGSITTQKQVGEIEGIFITPSPPSTPQHSLYPTDNITPYISCYFTLMYVLPFMSQGCKHDYGTPPEPCLYLMTSHLKIL